MINTHYVAAVGYHFANRSRHYDGDDWDYIVKFDLNCKLQMIVLLFNPKCHILFPRSFEKSKTLYHIRKGHKWVATWVLPRYKNDTLTN